MSTKIVEYKITRFQFHRDRPIGDAKVYADQTYVAAIELIDQSGRVGLGFLQSLFTPLPSEQEISRIFEVEIWPHLEGSEPGARCHQISRPRGGQRTPTILPFEEALQQATWDLFAQSLNMPLWKLLGAKRQGLPAYASGLDFHLDDDAFCALFEDAHRLGFNSFKIKVGHEDLNRDVHRLNLLKKIVGPDATLMVDANESWTVSQSMEALEAFENAGHRIFWLEDPIMREDFAGLRLLRAKCGRTRINSGEYLGASGKRELLEANACDMLNVHGSVTDVMRVGWVAAEKGIPVTMGNTFLEIGINMALALPETHWIEYSFQNFDHLVDKTYDFKAGIMYGADVAGHGLRISDSAREKYRVEAPVANPVTDLAPAPARGMLCQ